MEKQKIVIIGANSFQNRLILKAKALGMETHVFAWAAEDVGERSADYFYPISITEKEEILAKCREIQPVAICSIASDLAVLTVNYVARALGLTANSAVCDRVSTNKFAMRARFAGAGIYMPKYLKVFAKDIDTLHMPSEFHYPIIVKPTDRSGSRAINKLESADGLQEAIRYAIGESFEQAAIIEEYLEGKEYSCESISFNGEHHMLAITEKFTTGAPHFIETGHIEPAPLTEEQERRIQQVVFRALDALEIRFGASHAEFKLGKDGKVKIIEIGARMGGDCTGSDLVELSTGNDFVKMVIDVACGRAPEVVEEKKRRVAAIKFLMTEEEVLNRQALMDGLEVVQVSEISEDFTRPVVDSSSRYGYFIAVGEDYRAIREKLFG